MIQMIIFNNTAMLEIALSPPNAFGIERVRRLFGALAHTPPPSVRAILIETPHADMISARAMQNYTLSPENPNPHLGGKEPPQSLLERGGCQAPRQAAPVLGSPPATDVHGDVAFSKGCLLPVRPLPSVVLA